MSEQQHMPQIVRVNGQPRLLVDGQPFLMLGLQWDCESCFSRELMNPLFAPAAAMGANTVALPVYWREIEPTPDQFDFSMVDERLYQARANQLRVILLWFATWKNACTFYAPAYINEDSATYPKALDRVGQQTVSLCPSSEATWQRDRHALVALMEHLREVDDAHTVILFQVENEPGIVGSDRCYCSVCNERFAAEKWESTWGVHAAEAFSAASIASYIDRLAEAAKKVYALPLYVNVALPAAVGGIPGQYFSGGAVPEMLSLFRQHAPHLDLIGPDPYRTSYRDFHRFCQIYSADDNPLYIAEHSSSPEGRAERNVFYAIGQYGALGFDVWAIDASFPDRFAPPLVDPIGGEWAKHAYWLRDSYTAIGRAIHPIVEAQGTERIFTCIQEPAESSTGWAAQGCDVMVAYHDPEQAARGLLIQEQPDVFLLIGVGFTVQFRRPRPDGRPVPVVSAEWGRYEGNRWVMIRPVRRESIETKGNPLFMLEPGVMRVTLAL